jgi:hypothetical protein
MQSWKLPRVVRMNAAVGADACRPAHEGGLGSLATCSHTQKRLKLSADTDTSPLPSSTTLSVSGRPRRDAASRNSALASVRPRADRRNAIDPEHDLRKIVRPAPRVEPTVCIDDTKLATCHLRIHHAELDHP